MKHLKKIACALIATLFFANCSDDDKNPVTALTFDKDAVEILVGTEVPALVTVFDAEGKLTVLTKDPKGKGQVEVVISEEYPNVLEIFAKEAGEVLLLVKDERGKIGQIKVTVLDPVTRFIWNGNNKEEGVDGGSYTLVQDSKNGKASFTWTSDKSEGVKSIVLTFIDEGKKMAVGEKKEPTLTIDGKSIAIRSLSITNNVVVEKDVVPTIWMKFEADSKDGICVATLEIEPI